MTQPPPESPPEHGYRRLSPLTPVVRAPIVLIAVLSASWQQLISNRGIGTTGLLVLALLAAGAAYGVASWARTKYWIHDDELRIDTGVISRQSRRIRIDRLQGVDIVQPLVARLFGVAELRFDVAAGGDREGRLAYLPTREAEQLRELVLVRRDQLRQPVASSAWSAPAGAPQPAGAGEQLLARLDLGRLLASLALSTESLLLVAAAVALIGTSALTGEVAVAGGLVPTLLGFALALGRRLTAYYGFTLSQSQAGLQVRRGLTALSSQTVSPSRVQGLVVSQPLMWRPFGWAKLDVSIAGVRAADAGEVASASSTLMPVAPRAEVLALAAHVLAGQLSARTGPTTSYRDPTSVPLFGVPSRARWRAPVTAASLGCGQDDELLVARRGVLVRRVDVVPQARSQSVRITQGPVQRLLRLADVHVDSPPGPVRLVARHLDVGDARRFVADAVRLGRSARHGSSAEIPPTPQITQ